MASSLHAWWRRDTSELLPHPARGHAEPMAALPPLTPAARAWGVESRVARMEQVETPAMLKVRNSTKAKGKKDKVVTRKVCSVRTAQHPALHKCGSCDSALTTSWCVDGADQEPWHRDLQRP